MADAQPQNRKSDAPDSGHKREYHHPTVAPAKLDRIVASAPGSVDDAVTEPAQPGT